MSQKPSIHKLTQPVSRLLTADNINPGGALHKEHIDFMSWAAGYDDSSFTGRNIARQRAWLDALHCSVVELDSSCPPQSLLQAATERLGL